jgi:hypothetical protein
LLVYFQGREIEIAQDETSLAVKEEEQPLLYIHMDINISGSGIKLV